MPEDDLEEMGDPMENISVAFEMEGGDDDSETSHTLDATDATYDDTLIDDVEQRADAGVMHERRGSGLAVARLVDRQAEANKIIPSAVPFDPDSKVKLRRDGGRYRQFACMICFVLVAAALGMSLGIGLYRGKGKVESAKQELPAREQVGIREAIEAVVGEQMLSQGNSPYVKALEWITHEDSMKLVPGNTTFVQRYLLAYLYFATTEKKPWNSCSRPVGEQTSSCIHNKFSRDQLYGRNTFTPARRWLSVQPECSWGGVTCNSMEEVETIVISTSKKRLWPLNFTLSRLTLTCPISANIYSDGVNATGYFPSGITHLSSLKEFHGNSGFLRGTLPAEIATMQNLELLDVSFNELTGEIPESLWNAPKLRTLELGFNHFQGSISRSISNLKQASKIELTGNVLTGELPTEIGSCSGLRTFSVESNQLTGPIPTEIAHMTELRQFRVRDNGFSGSFPRGVENLVNMRYFDVAYNPRLGGSLPSGFWRLVEMQIVDISYTHLSGTISPEIADMKRLDGIYLSGSKFHGTVPPEFARLTRAHSVFIENTDMTGPMPDEICSRRVVAPSHNLRADCLPGENGQIEFECACCTACCRPDGSGCIRMP